MDKELCTFGALCLLVAIATTSAALCDPVTNASFYPVQKDAAVGSVVLEYEITGTNSEITLTEQKNEYFSLDTDSRSITLKKELTEVEENKGLPFMTICTTIGDNPILMSHELFFIVKTTNQQPEFTKSIYSFNVREDAEVGGTVYTDVSATDDDTGSNGDVYYRIVPNKYSDRFELRSDRNPTIILAKALDFEAFTYVSFLILAENAITSREEGVNATITINIIDVDDMDPSFTSKDYSATLKEDVGVGTKVNVSPPLIAEDQDTMKTPIKYSIAVGGDKFSIDMVSGQITVKTTLTVGHIPIIVQAWEEDDPSQSDWAAVNIYVVATDNTNPSFEYISYSATVSEAAEIGTTLLIVKGSDPDTDSGLSYSLAEPSTHFEMNGGSILLKSSLDYETDKEYTFNVNLTDGSYTVQAEVVITVTDVNDNTPVITNGKLSTFEIYPAAETTIYTVEASDADVKDSLTFHLETNKALFSIGEFDGVVKVTVTEKIMKLDEYLLMVVVRDNGEPFREAFARLTVQILRHPTFEKETYTVTASEDEHVDALLFTVLASDDNFGASLVYSIIENTVMFDIDSNSGRIYLHKELDFEKQQVHNFQVVASDTINMATATVQLTVIDVNDNSPEILNGDELTLIIDPIAGAEVHSIQASDADEGTILTYHMRVGEPLFSVDDKGIVKISAIEEVTAYTNYIVVEVRDDVSNYRRAFVEIFVKLEQNPVFVSNNSIIVLENKPVNSLLLTVIATDDELGNGIQYDILESTSMFKVDADNGNFFLLEKLDYETSQYHSLHLTATDGKHTTTAEVTITVIDVNDNSPEITNGEFVTVKISPISGTIAHTIKATDADRNDTLSFHLEDNNMFSVGMNDGIVRFDGTEDKLRKNEYYLLVKVRDDTEPIRETSVGLTVQFIRHPRFEETNVTVTVSEAHPVGSILFTTTAIDEDIDAKIEYAIVEETQLFMVDSKSGRVYLNESLDYEMLTVHVIHVTASDTINQTATTTVELNVADINDNGPVIENGKMIEVVIDLMRDAIVHHIKATDADPGTVLTYHMVDGGTLFSVNDTGTVTISASEEQLTANEYYVLVEVRDDGTPYRNTFVRILVKLTREPVFMSNYSISVLENEAVDAVLLTVVATDDGFENSLQYGMLEDSAMFEVDEVSGDIILRKSLDYETTRQYILHATASDKKHTATATVEINLININDNNPEVTEEIVYVTMELKQNADVHKIEASDKDPGTVLTYYLDRGEPYFTVDVSSGLVTIAEEESIVPEQEYMVKVMVRDDVTHYRETSVIIFVTFSRVPTFNPANYRLTVSEAEVNGFLLLVLTADDDQLEIQYELVEDTSFFRIDNNSGAIFLNEALNYEKSTTHTLHVTASDGSHMATATVIIDVADVNDNNPEVDQEHVEVHVKRGINTTIHTINAADADLEQKLTFHILNDEQLFSVDTEGVVKIAVADNMLPLDVYYVVVKVSDNGTPHREATVIIKVVVITVTKFYFDTYQAHVSEAQSAGATIITVTAQGTDIEYELVESVSFVDIDRLSGTIVLKEALDYEDSTHRTLHVSATDGSATDTATVIIIVDDINDNNPDVNQTEVEVDADRGINKVIHTIEATDADVNQKLFFEIVYGEELFSVDNEGVVKIAVADEKLPLDVYVIIVKVSDDGTPPRETTVTINVVFMTVAKFYRDNYYVQVSEARTAGATILTVAAQGENLEYSFNEESSLFSIEKNSGTITLQALLDYEKTQEHNLHVIAKAGMTSATAAVSIAVEDSNDNSPDILNGEHVSASPKRKKNEFVHAIEATDADANTVLSYDMAIGASLFSVDSTGVVTISADSKNLTDDDYHILVKIRDGDLAYREAFVAIAVEFIIIEPPSPVSQAGDEKTLLILIGALAGVFLIILLAVLINGRKQRKAMKSRLKKYAHLEENLKGSPSAKQTIAVGFQNPSFDDQTDQQDQNGRVAEMTHQYTEVPEIPYEPDYTVPLKRKPQSEYVHAVEELDVPSVSILVEDNSTVSTQGIHFSTFKPNTTETDDDDDFDDDDDDDDDAVSTPPSKKAVKFTTPSMENISTASNIQVEL